eukprot:635702-Hanusia_phi.AAC.1
MASSFGILMWFCSSSLPSTGTIGEVLDDSNCLSNERRTESANQCPIVRRGLTHADDRTPGSDSGADGSGGRDCWRGDEGNCLLLAGPLPLTLPIFFF